MYQTSKEGLSAVAVEYHKVLQNIFIKTFAIVFLIFICGHNVVGESTSTPWKYDNYYMWRHIETRVGLNRFDQFSAPNCIMFKLRFLLNLVGISYILIAMYGLNSTKEVEIIILGIWGLDQGLDGLDTYLTLNQMWLSKYFHLISLKYLTYWPMYAAPKGPKSFYVRIGRCGPRSSIFGIKLKGVQDIISSQFYSDDLHYEVG